MSFNPLKWCFYAAVAAVEITFLHLGATLVALAFRGEPRFNWLALLIVALVAAWATWRFEPPDPSPQDALIRRPTIITCVIAVLIAVKGQMSGWNPLSGWSALLPWVSTDVLMLVAVLLITLWAWWRGMGIIDADHMRMIETIQQGTLVLAIIALLATPLAVVNLGAPPWGARLAIEAIVLTGSALLALSLGRTLSISIEGDANGWRRFRSGLFSIVVLLVVGTLALALVSDAATDLLRTAIVAVVALGTLIIAPIVEAAIRLWFWISMAYGRDPAQPVPSPSAIPSLAPAATPPVETQPNLLVSLLSLALFLIPLLILIALILMVQRRRGTRASGDGAQHESLWSWQQIRGDLGGLFGQLRRNRSLGLRDALSRLRGDDPIQRIRRRYVQALLLGEKASRERQPQQTPLEYEPQLASIVAADRDVEALTDVYDRARYAPESIDQGDVEAADRAWNTIRQVNKEPR